MIGETIAGVAVFTVIALILVFSWLCSESAKGSEKPSESALAGKVTDVSTEKENVSDELPEPPGMRQGNGERVPLQKRVQPIKSKVTSTPARQDVAYSHPVIDTFDYHAPVRSSADSSSGGYCSGDSSSSSDSGGSSGCD